MKKGLAIGISVLALAGGAVGFFLRKTEANGGSGIPLAALGVVLTVIFALSVVTLEREGRFSAIFGGTGADRFLSVLAGCAIAVGAVLSGGEGILRMIILAFGVLAGLVIAFDPLLRKEDHKKARFAYIFPVLFYTVRLFADFRTWEIDPALTDYCYRLFACIGFMLAAYQVGAFTFDKGGRRMLAFFSLVGLTFGFVSLQGSALGELLFYSGSSLWMLRLSLDAMLPASAPASQASDE